MGKYWLLDRHGADGPSVLVETDGSMRVRKILRFGPGITELEDQQTIVDDVMGRAAPTMKPMLASNKVAEKGIELHADLQHDGDRGTNAVNRHGDASQSEAGARVAGGSKRTGGRGRG